MCYGLTWRGGPWSLVCRCLRVALWDMGVGYGIQGRDPNWWSTTSVRWSLLVACCVSTFRGGSWASADRALWSAFFARLSFNSHEYQICSVEKKYHFSNSAPKPRNSTDNNFLHIIMLCKSHLADHIEFEKMLTMPHHMQRYSRKANHVHLN